MKKHMGMVTLALLVVVVLLLSTVLYQVDEQRDIVVIKTFGKITKVNWEPGLHVKWPYLIQETVRYDRRTMTFEDPYKETGTKDQKAVVVSMYCNWRIRDAAKFHDAVRTMERGRELLRDRLNTIKADVFGQYTIGELVNTDVERMKLREIEGEILTRLAKEADDEFGVEVRSVGISVLGLPESIAETVIDTQIKERESVVQDYRSQGEADATDIRERAKAASRKILAFASRKAADIRTEGDRAAAERQFEEVVHDWPGGPQGYLELGLVRMRQGEYAEAIPALSKVAQAAPAAGPVHYDLALCYDRIGQAALAYESYERALGAGIGAEERLRAALRVEALKAELRFSE